MTIKQLATALNVTPQAVYKRINRLQTDGTEVKALKDPETGHLTPEAVELLARLFNKPLPTVEQPLNNDDKPVDKPMNNDSSTVDNNTGDVDNELIALRVEVELLRQRLADVSAERDEWRQQAQTAALLVQQQQALMGQQLKALPQPAPRRTFFQWLTRRKGPETE